MSSNGKICKKTSKVGIQFVALELMHSCKQHKFDWRISDITSIAYSSRRWQQNYPFTNHLLICKQDVFVKNGGMWKSNLLAQNKVPVITYQCFKSPCKPWIIGYWHCGHRQSISNFNKTQDKQRVLMHGHQGWNVRHGLCHIYMIYVYIWVVYSFCLFCCLFIIVTTQFVALYKPCKPKPKPSTYDPPDNHPLAEIQSRYLDRSQSNKYAINMQIQTISVSK